MATTNFSALPQDVLLNIARKCLLPKTNKYKIREYPHSNQIDFDLLAVGSRGRAALLEILRREILFIEVIYYECTHRANIDPRYIEPRDRRLLGEGTHPDLNDVFGRPEWHPALRLKRAGHTVHAIQIGIRCVRLCQQTRAYTVAFVPAQTHHILALCPILQRVQRPVLTTLGVGFIEMMTDGVDTSYPIIRPQLREAVDLIQNILPGVCRGALTPEFIAETRADLGRFYGDSIDAEGWPIIEPFLLRYLTELEASIAAGTPIHELAGLAENFLGNKLYPGFGDHGADRDLDNSTFLSIFSIFNRYQCIFMDGLAEFLLRREANVAGQTHHVLNPICDETHFLWYFFNRIMGTNAYWVRRVIEDWTSPQNFTKPSEASLSLFLQCGAARLAEIRLRFAMARARRAQPSLHHYQNICIISLMATPTDRWGDSSLVSQQIEGCQNGIRTLITKIRLLRQVYRIETPGLIAMWAKAEELLTIINLETANHQYQFDDWVGVVGFDRRPVLRQPPGKYEIFQVEHTSEVLSLIDEMRRRELFRNIIRFN